MTDLEFRASRLSEEELLCQIAEEASELAQAALKRRRAITQHNPTPTPPESALYDLYEEYGDLLNAINAYLIKLNLIPIKAESYPNRRKYEQAPAMGRAAESKGR